MVEKRDAFFLVGSGTISGQSKAQASRISTSVLEYALTAPQTDLSMKLASFQVLITWVAGIACTVV